ncbi:leucyl aminopeptidase family protein [Ferroacidibacillus organovorans]|uniref:leucyl aminopeptidase family protein n=1 Tax=Ferroacidibacillus organovorans TaxID=1765683 RepID=UPI000ABA717F|nr:leucyl aminopeptidase family protein [Ferroacidibacillus organovorans]
MNIHLSGHSAQPAACHIELIHTNSFSSLSARGVAKRHSTRHNISLFHERDASLITVGLGDPSTVDEETLRDAAGLAIRAAAKEEWEDVSIGLPHLLEAEREIHCLVEGVALGAYRFDRYQSKKDTHLVKTVTLMADERHVATLARALAFVRGTMLARDLVNEPPNRLRPATLAEFVTHHFRGSKAEVTVLAGQQLIDQQMNGLIAVGKGSEYPPRFIQVTYATDPTRPLIALVGKGVTFDTGGISLKGGRDISNMRMDMGGAGAVIGALDILIQLDLPCNVVGLIAATENIPDAGSMLPGELIQYRNGTSVQVANTDAEGRLILADALIRAQELHASEVLDIATLTGSAAAALGSRYAAVFGGDDIVSGVKEAGLRSGDYVWQMPLPESYREQLKSVYADLSNIGKGQGGAIVAALFLKQFVADDQAWAHIDMAGPMESEKTAGYRPHGATGYGARLLAEYVLKRVGHA